MSALLLLSGSRRRESYNGRLLRWLAGPLASRGDIDLVEAQQVDLPLFDQDLETDASVVRRVAALHARFARCDGIVVACPEYNGQPTPYLKNTIDWVSRLPHIDPAFENPFVDRPVLLCSASTGWSGGALALPHLRALFGYIGCVVIGDAICLPHADRLWTRDGYEFDPFFEAQTHEAVGRLLRLAGAFAATRNEVSATG